MHAQQGEKTDKTPKVIAGRYQVEKRLGKGGMGTVYRVFDRAAERRVALKLLGEKAAQIPTISALFEREYHTLTQLAHPRIVEVYDYGVDESGWAAYYTMELLDGADLRKLAPVPWKDACALLRDVASSLALLHSRRLLHRDVSARNVRCTADGRAKLIDFGAMVPLGSPPKLIGTPPYVAPEAYHLQPLDQRADLYSLGALAYWLISGHYAYQAKELALLPEAWRSQPKALSTLVPEVPQALNDLVMSLLSLDRMARPFCAAEVMERLAAIGGLDADEQVTVSQAYLNTPSLIGRRDSLVVVQRRILRALAGKGSTLMVSGRAGTGRSRFLDACVLEARLAGALVLRADATDANAGNWGVVQAVARQLLDALPQLALEAARPFASVLGHILPELLGRLEAGSRESLALQSFDTPQELRPQVQAALLDWLVELSKRRCLVMAVDDVHRIDEPSAAFAALVSHRALKERLVVVVTAETDAPAISEQAVSLLSEVATGIRLTNLGLAHTEELLCSVFGQVPNVRLVSDRLHAISGGNPKAIMQLAQHLLDRAMVRYEAGAWSLPNGINSADLPQTISEALKARLHGLSANALALAQSMALCSTQRFSLEDCSFLVCRGDKATLVRDIDQLIAADVLQTDGTWYALSQASWRPVLTEELDDEHARVLHLRLAELLQKQAGQRLRVAQHLLLANQPERALDALLKRMDAVGNSYMNNPAVVIDFIQSLPEGWISTVAALVEVCDQLGRPRRQRFVLLQHLATVASVTAQPQQRLLSQLLHQLYCDAGLDLYEKQDSSQDDSVRVQSALQLAQQRFDATPEAERVLSPAEAIPELARTIVRAIGSVGHAMDHGFFEAMPSLGPLVGLSPALGVIEKNFESSRHAQGGRYERARRGWREAIERMDQPDRAGLDELHHTYMRLAMACTVGGVEALLGLESAANWADQIEQNPLFEVNAWWLRMLLALRQGDYQKAGEYRRGAELLQIQNSPTQLFEGLQLWIELLGYAALEDLLGVKQTLSAIQKMADKLPGWMPALHYARGQYQKIRGNHSRALAEFEQGLCLTAPGGHMAWAPIAGAHLSTLVELGQFDRVEALAQIALEVAQREDPVMSIQIRPPLALAQAALNEFDNAVTTAQAVIDALEKLHASGVVLGAAYETRARVAISMQDQDSFRTYAQLCAAQYGAGRNPASTAKYERLIQAAREANLGMPKELRCTAELSVSLNVDGKVVSNVRQRLAGCNERAELFDRALGLVVERTGSQWGYLYLLADGELVLAARSTALDPPEDLLSELRAFVARFVGEQTEREQSEIPTRSCFLQSCASHFRALEPVLLATEVDGESLVVGVAVVCQEERNPEQPGYAFYEAVARCLYEADHQPASFTGDATPKRKRDAADNALADGRYAIETVLGKGGMGAVFRARDTAAGKLVALKRALVPRQDGQTYPAAVSDDDTRERRRLEALLQREYHTLQSLAHPRIVEVYDFAVDKQGPYYTMELLDGKDLRQLAPLPWQKACELLRDVASSLSLLHSRRLLHRDITARNVRCTAEGHAKLMDFGAMMPMGLPKNTVGTPPHMPPESIYSQPLDQRSDLYSLGALAYWLLTGRHAYPAKNTEELVDMWRSRPAAPSSLVPEIPEALDTLVMSLLSLEPVARPACAAEVMERVSAIANLPVDEQLSVPQAYLTTPTLVGRDKLLVEVRKQVVRALQGRGGIVMVQGPQGVGRSRFLDACVLEGKLAGLPVLRADASDAQAGDYAVARALVRQLMREVPTLGLRMARSHLSVLRHVLPELDATEPARSKSSGAAVLRQEQQASQIPPPVRPHLDHDSVSRLRPHIQAALRQWLVDIAQYSAFMIAVDDAHRIDEPSAALLALLGDEAKDCRLVIAVSAETDASATAPAALNLLCQTDARVMLTNLELEQSQQLLSSVFGPVPNVRLLADRLHKNAQGNPRAIMQLAQHLVNAGTIHYQAGAWTLPNSFAGTDWPASLTEALKARAQKLDAYARRLAETMALSPEDSVSFEECLMLAEHQDASRLAQSLDELVASEIISTDGQHYCLSHRSWVSVFAEALDEDHTRALHLRLAEMFELRGDHERFRAAQHLLRAGEEERALDEFVRFAEASKELTDRDPTAFSDLLQSLPQNWFESYEASLQLCQKLQRPRKESYVLLRRLLGLTALTGKGSLTHVQALVEQLHRDSGLGIYEGLGDCLDSSVRLQRALELTQQRFDECPEEQRVLPPAEAIAELARALIQATSYAVYCFEWRLLESLPSLGPLIALSPALGVVETTVQSACDMLSAKYENARQGCLDVLKRTSQSDRAGLDEAHHRYTRFAVMYGLGLIESNFGFKSSLGWASQIEEDCFHQVNAWRIRMLYHLWQGDAQKAEECAQRLELLQIQNSPSQHWEGTHVWREVVAHALADNLMGVKQNIASVEEMASRYPGWLPVLHCAQGAYQRIRGDYQSALSEFECALDSSEQGRHTVWPFAAGAHLATLLALGRYEEAKRLGRERAAFSDEAGIGFWGGLIKMPLAIAEARLGEYEKAIRGAEAVIDTMRKLGATGSILGSAYETRAHIAILMNDADGFAAYAELCEEQYRAGHNPALTAKYERLVEAARKAGLQVADRDEDPGRDDIACDQADRSASIRNAIAGCRDQHQRAQKALALLLDHCDAKSGHLFGTQEDGLTWLSSMEDGASCEAPPDELRQTAELYMAAEAQEPTAVTETTADQDTAGATGSRSALTLDDGTGFEPVLLFSLSEGRSVLVGVAALVPRDQRLCTPNPEFVSAIGDALLDTGDVVSVFAAA